MFRSLTVVLTLSLSAACTTTFAQDAEAPAADEMVPCSACHTCDNPTPENLCLRPCARASAAAVAEYLTQRKRGPDVVILDELEDLYLPVPFDHKGHANMAEMTQGCVVCHHYTPEGREVHPACRTCHEVSPVREDMRKPGLKGAYHRQCMSCHREWSHETACETCHPPKAGRVEQNPLASRPTEDDIVGRMHPPIPEPDTKVYQTRHRQRAGTNVTFRHKEHIHRFGFKCAECHREDSCSRCHEEGMSEAGRVKTLEEHHNPCVACHDMESPAGCDHCHWEVGHAAPPRFDHASTGWPLGKYHVDSNCRMCHEAVPFVKLDRQCNVCHADWAPDNFDHRVTGQALDENHAETDCEECHIDRKFDVPPRCDECHDEDEGIAFPAKRPGAVVKPEESGGAAKPGDGAQQRDTVPAAEKGREGGPQK